MTKQRDLFPAPEPPRQLTLDLPRAPPAMTRANFVVTESNAAAFAAAQAWARSAEPTLVVCGPPASGKTHLARIVAEIAPAAIVDGLERWDDPRSLLARLDGAGGRLVLVGRGDPSGWARGLKDLRTRLSAAPRAALVEPDEALLRAVLAKMFRDRQLRAGEAIADFAIRRLPQTFAAAQAFVEALDARSIETGQPIGPKLARAVAANLSEAPAGAYDSADD
jgi:chromosomal replication initiation ATPase DnaA